LSMAGSEIAMVLGGLYLRGKEWSPCARAAHLRTLGESASRAMLGFVLPSCLAGASRLPER
jgi:hypothetical protein